MTIHRLHSTVILALSSTIWTACDQSEDTPSEVVSGQSTTPGSPSSSMTMSTPVASSTDVATQGSSSGLPPASSTATPSQSTTDVASQPPQMPTQPPQVPTQPSSSATAGDEPSPALSASTPSMPEDPTGPKPADSEGSNSEGGTEPDTKPPGAMSDAGGEGPVTSPAPGEAIASAGCGMQAPADCAPCQANGLDYYVDMPENYDPTHPYPVVFQYHPLGGSGQQARTMYRVQPTFPDAIYVSPDGSDNGFPNADGVDEAVTRTIMDTIEATLCVDTNRYFATGFSYGGSMSYTAACNMSDKFRAVAAMAGAPISGAACTRTEPTRPVAVLGIHGEEDTALPITMAEPIIESWLDKNGCSRDTQPSDLLDSICERAESALEAGAYQGCMDGYPVIWCPMPSRPHEIPGWSGATISKFFQQF